MHLVSIAISRVSKNHVTRSFIVDKISHTRKLIIIMLMMMIMIIIIIV